MHALQRAESAARKSEADAGDDVPQQSSSDEEFSDYVDTGDDQGDDELSDEDNVDNEDVDDAAENEDVDQPETQDNADNEHVDDAAENEDVDDPETEDYAEKDDVHHRNVPASIADIPPGVQFGLIPHHTDPCKSRRNCFPTHIT